MATTDSACSAADDDGEQRQDADGADEAGVGPAPRSLASRRRIAPPRNTTSPSAAEHVGGDQHEGDGPVVGVVGRAPRRRGAVGRRRGAADDVLREHDDGERDRTGAGESGADVAEGGRSVASSAVDGLVVAVRVSNMVVSFCWLTCGCVQ